MKDIDEARAAIDECVALLPEVPVRCSVRIDDVTYDVEDIRLTERWRSPRVIIHKKRSR